MSRSLSPGKIEAKRKLFFSRLEEKQSKSKANRKLNEARRSETGEAKTT
jgi:hypothetical protein